MSTRERAGLIAALVVLAVIAAQSARLGASGLLAGFADAEVDQWKSAIQSISPEKANRARAQLAASLRVAGDNPWALERFGLLQLAAVSTYRNPQQALAATRDARERFRAALRQRPASPYLWADLALAKLYLDERDEELFAAMRHADVLGAREPAVQETLLFVGLALWEDLDAGLQEGRRASIRRAAPRPEKMLGIAKRFGRLDLVCGLSEYNHAAGKDCRDIGAAAGKRRAGGKR
jgi:hypothetical protein